MDHHVRDLEGVTDMQFAETLRTWLRDPVVAPLFVLLVLTLAILALSIVRAIQAGTFDATLLPRFLRDYVLAEFLPLTILGFLVWIFGFVYPEPDRDVLQQLGLAALAGTYATGAAAAIAKYVAKLLALISPQPDELEMDQPVTGDAE